MQKTIPYYFLLISLLVMTGCQDMFYREVDFEGETEPEMIVLTGNFHVNEVPEVTVSHSFFFSRKNKRSDDWLKDAEVSLSVNGETYPLQYRDSGIYANAGIPPLRPLDTVEVVAIHPDYATATAQQIMPNEIRSTVSNLEIHPSGLMSFRVNIDAYHGNADDVIGIRARGLVKSTWTNPDYGETYVLSIRLNTVFSNDILFAEADNTTTDGYYGAIYDNYLYFPASELKEPRQVQILLDSYQLRWDEHDTIEPEQLEVEVSACSFSAYRFARSTHPNTYIPTPSFLPEKEENFMEVIMEVLQEALGDQEPVQVYTNVDGGLGHVAGFYTNKIDSL